MESIASSPPTLLLSYLAAGTLQDWRDPSWPLNHQTPRKGRCSEVVAEALA